MLGADFRSGVGGNGKVYQYALLHSERNFKEVPKLYERPEYLMGFLAGYFVADGNCFNNKLTIYSHKYDDLYKIQQICTVLGIMSTEIGVSNIHKGKRGCVEVKKDTNGYTLRLVRNTIPDNFFISEKGRGSFQRYTGKNSYKVLFVELTDIKEDVYCCQTSTHSFALEHFILTGNCFACGETHTLPEMISFVFGHNDMTGGYGWSWLIKNFLSIEVENRQDIQLDFSRGKKKEEAKQEYVSEEELDSYRYTHPYWEKRGIVDDDIIELFDLGYDKHSHCITFPVRDISGNCLFVARRNVKTKFFNYPKGVVKPLYGLYEFYADRKIGGVDELDVDPRSILVCESMIDCILLWQAGHYAVALNGLGNNLQMKQLEDLPCRELVLATDNDKAGDDARDRIKSIVKGKIFSEIIFPKGIKDIGECSAEQVKNILDWREYV